MPLLNVCKKTYQTGLICCNLYNSNKINVLRMW
jgi:hypothetical protein